MPKCPYCKEEYDEPEYVGIYDSEGEDDFYDACPLCGEMVSHWSMDENLKDGD